VLTHAGWEALGPVAAERRESYATGWRTVLARYVAASNASAGRIHQSGLPDRTADGQRPSNERRQP
jgi:hypothetical protein